MAKQVRVMRAIALLAAALMAASIASAFVGVQAPAPRVQTQLRAGGEYTGFWP